MEAPFIRAMVFKAVVPLSDSSGVKPSSLYIIDFRDTPTNNGKPITCNLSSSPMI